MTIILSGKAGTDKFSAKRVQVYKYLERGFMYALFNFVLPEEVVHIVEAFVGVQTLQLSVPFTSPVW